jgi:hypothetical protein
MTPDRYGRLAGLMLSGCAEALDSACAGCPGEFREILDRAVELAASRRELSLAACAASAWCGADPETGIPGAVAAHLLDASMTSHLTLPGFSLGLQSEPLWSEFDEASAILAGDALVPAAIGFLAGKGGFQSVRLMRNAAAMLGAGILPGFSLELSLRSKDGSIRLEREDIWKMHAGSISRFAAEAGAILAGADQARVDRAALAGREFGRAADLLMTAECPSKHSSGLADGHRLEESKVLFDEALSSLGDGPGTDMFRSLAGAILESLRGADLFGG